MVWGAIAGYVLGRKGGGGGGDSRERSYQKIGATGPTDIPLDDTFRPRYLPDGQIAQDVQFEVGRATDRYNRQQRETGISVLANQGASEGVYSRGGAASLLSGTAANVSNAYFRNQVEEPYVSYWGDRDAELRARKDAQKAGYLGLAGNLASAALSAAGGGFGASVNVGGAAQPQAAQGAPQAAQAAAAMGGAIPMANAGNMPAVTGGTGGTANQQAPLMQASLPPPGSGASTVGGGGAPEAARATGAMGGAIPSSSGASGGPGSPGAPGGTPRNSPSGGGQPNGFIGPPLLQAAVAEMDPRIFDVEYLQVSTDMLDELLREALGALGR